MNPEAESVDVSSRTFWVQPFAFLFLAMAMFMTGGMLFFAIPDAFRHDPGELLFLTVGVGFLGFFWVTLITTPFLVRVDENGVVAFRSVRRTLQIEASQISRVKAGSTFEFESVKVFHSGGVVRLAFPLAESFQFVSHLQHFNPRISIGEQSQDVAKPLSESVAGNNRIDGGRVQEFRIPPLTILFPVITGLATLIMLVVPFLPGEMVSDEPFDARTFLILMYGTLAWFWFNILTTPYLVTIDAENCLKLKSLLRLKEVSVGEIVGVRGFGLDAGVVIRHTKGRIWMKVAVEDLLSLVSRLREINPNIEIRGI